MEQTYLLLKCTEMFNLESFLPLLRQRN